MAGCPAYAHGESSPSFDRGQSMPRESSNVRLPRAWGPPPFPSEPDTADDQPWLQRVAATPHAADASEFDSVNMAAAFEPT